MFLKIGYLQLSLLLLTGCAQLPIPVQLQQPTVPIEPAPKAVVVNMPADPVYPVFDQEARLWDVPFALPETIYDLSTQEAAQRKYVLQYRGRLAPTDTVAFYRAQMDCLGWQEQTLVSGVIECLVFVKPTKWCIVTVTPVPICPEKSHVTLFLGSPHAVY